MFAHLKIGCLDFTNTALKYFVAHFDAETDCRRHSTSNQWKNFGGSLHFGLAAPRMRSFKTKESLRPRACVSKSRTNKKRQGKLHKIFEGTMFLDLVNASQRVVLNRRVKESSSRFVEKQIFQTSCMRLKESCECSFFWRHYAPTRILEVSSLSIPMNDFLTSLCGNVCFPRMVMDINAASIFMVSKAVIKQGGMLEAKDRPCRQIINISSRAGKVSSQLLFIHYHTQWIFERPEALCLFKFVQVCLFAKKWCTVWYDWSLGCTEILCSWAFGADFFDGEYMNKWWILFPAQIDWKVDWRGLWLFRWRCQDPCHTSRPNLLWRWSPSPPIHAFERMCQHTKLALVDSWVWTVHKHQMYSPFNDQFAACDSGR